MKKGRSLTTVERGMPVMVPSQSNTVTLISVYSFLPHVLAFDDLPLDTIFKVEPAACEKGGNHNCMRLRESDSAC